MSTTLTTAIVISSIHRHDKKNVQLDCMRTTQHVVFNIKLVFLTKGWNERYAGRFKFSQKYIFKKAMWI